MATPSPQSLLSGRIVEWNGERGFGYVESQGQHIFLHAKDFVKKHKIPEVGDAVTFEIGADAKGRPCAKRAVHPREGGRLTSENILFLSLLLLAPISALVRYSRQTSPLYLTIYWMVLCVFTYGVYAWDKQRARNKKQREPEILLHTLELLGGWPGAFIAQRHLRHKCAKLSYQASFWLIVCLHQFVAIDYLRDWTAIHRVFHQLEKIVRAK